MQLDDAMRKEFLKTKLLAIALLTLAPVVYLLIAILMKTQGSIQVQSGGEVDIMFYVLIVIALVSPALLPLIMKVQMGNLRRGAQSKASPAQLMTTLFIIKFAVIEATFVYGMVVFFLSGDTIRMLLFYPIGAIWAVIHWPTEERMNKIIQRLEAV